MRDEAFEQDLARWRIEAESGDRLTVINEILDDISSHLSVSIVDNSERIAKVDELLGLTEDPANRNGKHRAPSPE